MSLLESIWALAPWSGTQVQSLDSLVSLVFSSLPLWQAIVFMVLFAKFTDYWHHRKGLIRLPQVRPPLPPEPTPALDVGVVVPARDEERRIHLCLRSLLRSSGLWRLRIAAVNDRSHDSTRQLMDDTAKATDLVKVVNIDQLPADWIGKPHACWQGAMTLREWPGGPPEFILFTDGDVIFHERALFEAALHMKRKNLDFITAFPRPEFHSHVEGAFLSFFAMMINFFSKPWAMDQRGGKNHIGIGAFIMVRTSSYFKLGGHQAIKYNIPEDLKLALLFRGAKLPCAVVMADDRLSLRWGDGFVATWRGLLKNVFAAFEYSLLRTIAGCFAVCLIYVSPWMSLFADQFTAILAVGNLMQLALMHYFLAKELGSQPVSIFLLSPIMALSFCALALTSAYKTITEGGILWRDRFYPLRLLKRQKLSIKNAFRINKT